MIIQKVNNKRTNQPRWTRPDSTSGFNPSALIFLMKTHNDPDHINIGTGKDKLFKFTKFKVVSAGSRDPDAQGA